MLFFKGNYLQRVLGVHKAALQFLPLAWVWSVAVDQGDQVGEPPELSHLQGGQGGHVVYQWSPSGRRCKALPQGSLTYSC